MDSIPDEARCTCTPKVVRGEKQYPPKMGEGVKLQEGEAGKEEEEDVVGVGVKEGEEGGAKNE